MSRLLIVPFIFIMFNAFSQNNTKSMLKTADHEVEKGNYIFAIEIYEELLQKDTLSIDLIWKIAEANRCLKNYKEAENHYKKIIAFKAENQFSTLELMLGLILKSQAKYDEAITFFKMAKKKLATDKKSFGYRKAKHELQSCLWAKQASEYETDTLEFKDLPQKINSFNTELAPIIHNNQLYFTGVNSGANHKNYIASIYRYNYKLDSLSLFIEDSLHQANFANSTFSLDQKRFYFASCSDNNCVIMVKKLINDKWTKADTLGEIINEKGVNTTMPAIGKIDGNEVLFFSSDRSNGSKGKLDIWYTSIKNGNQYTKPKNIKSINSIDHEISPWFDTLSNTLYFSSEWNDNLGGFDIFASQYTDQFQRPVNLGKPFNSSFNDVYFSKNIDTSYFSSNRIGSQNDVSETCCNDLFKVIPKPLMKNDRNQIKETDFVELEKASLAELNKRLPIQLYFHNDIPNPRSVDTSTKVNYINSYHEYLNLIKQYQKEYSTGLTGIGAENAKEDISDFFTEYVVQGVKKLELFRNQLLIELEKGAKINLQIKGFASPLAKSDYNTKLTKRRIHSLINYLKEYDNGIFLPYIKNTAENKGRLTFEEIPFGEDNANKLTSDNPNDTKNSIYSRAAALERKIEIRSVTDVSSITDTSSIAQSIDKSLSLTSSNQIIQIPSISNKEISTYTFKVKNNASENVKIESVDIPCECNTVDAPSIINANEETTVKMTFNPEGYSGKIVKSVYIKVEGQSEKLRLVITGTVE